ncbi:hypothetical protein GF356_07060 [candidate division GN15 bacterium]|nr:hypothetical protein [candidate division GN15 bacterium]
MCGRVLMLVVALMLTGLAVPAAIAETEIDLGGELRFRAEVDRRAFDKHADVAGYFDLRSRLSVDALVDSNARAFLQFQDSRRLGMQNSDGSYVSGTLSGGSNVDVHQAYIEILEYGDNGIGLKAGRFEIALGNQRVFGTVGWSNTGRSWEGIRLNWQGRQFDVRAYGLIRRELNREFENRDFVVIGLASAQPQLGSELFAFLEENRDRPAGAGIPKVDSLKRASVGGYIKQDIGPFTVESNLVYQFGSQLVYDGSFFEQDISAFLVTAELSTVIDKRHNIALAAGVDYASGDDDPADGTYNAYNNLYYTGHKFRGHMDYFLSSQPEGLVDLVFRFNGEFIQGWKVGAHLHHFIAASDYVGQNGELTNKIGSELDVFGSTRKVKGAYVSLGGSAFLPSEEFAGEGAEVGLWGYWLVTVTF